MRSNYVQDYDKWVKAGRGQGRYSAYDPWITVQDCHSKTPRHRVPCPRLHTANARHLLQTTLPELTNHR